MDIDIESLLKTVVEAADIEILWEKPATGESGFISRQPYSSGGERPVTGEERLSRIPKAFHDAVNAALSQVGVVAEFPYKQDDWYDYQWFEMRMIDERKDTDGESIKIYFSRRIQQTKTLELMLQAALDGMGGTLIEENLSTGTGHFLFKHSLNLDTEPQLIGARRREQLGSNASEMLAHLEQVNMPIEFEAVLLNRDDTVWVRQTNIRNFVNERGEPSRWLLAKRVTEAKQAELAVKDAYERLHRSTRMGNVGTFTFDFTADLFELNDISRHLMALPKEQFPVVDTDKLLSYVVGTNARQLRENIAYNEQVRGTQTLEMNVRGWDGIYRWVRFRFEFLDASEGLLACGVIVDITETVRAQTVIAQQLRKLEDQQRIADTAIDAAKMVLIEFDLDSRVAEIISGKTPHERLYSSLDIDCVQQQIYLPEDYERQKLMRDNPGQTTVVRTMDNSGQEFLFNAEVGYTPSYRRGDRVYQIYYRRIVDDANDLNQKDN